MNASLMSLLWFVVILAAIPGILWLFKRSPMGGSLRSAAHAPVRTVAAVSLGPQQRVVTVEVGEGAQRRWLVLGVTATHINTLHTLDAPPAVPAQAAPVQINTPSFAGLLAALRGTRAEDRDAH